MSKKRQRQKREDKKWKNYIEKYEPDDKTNQLKERAKNKLNNLNMCGKQQQQMLKVVSIESFQVCGKYPVSTHIKLYH